MGDQHMVRAEARIDPDQRHETADEKRGADEKDDGQRDLPDNEGASHTPARSPRGSTSAVFQRVREIGLR